jgi:hypothetical protein
MTTSTVPIITAAADGTRPRGYPDRFILSAEAVGSGAGFGKTCSLGPSVIGNFFFSHM